MKALVLALLVFGSAACTKAVVNGGRTPLSQVPVGSWAEYRLTLPTGHQSLVIGVVGRDARSTVVETTMTEGEPSSPSAPIVDRQVFALADDFGKPPIAAAIQVGSYEPMTRAPADVQSNVDFSRLSPKDIVARGSITVPAGTFAALHYKTAVEGSSADLWVSDRVLPTGIVKMRLLPPAGASATEEAVLELQRMGTGAKPRIQKSPRPFDRDVLTRELMSIAGGQPQR
ncbi:MAG TPA: hypothetical protein VGF45_24730 [Polyangia bacterium]